LGIGYWVLGIGYWVLGIGLAELLYDFKPSKAKNYKLGIDPPKNNSTD